MSRRILIACLAAVVLLGMATDGRAQFQQSGQAGTSSFGSTGVGTGSFNSSGFGSIGLGSGGFGSSSSSSSSFGSGGFGSSSAFGTGGFGGAGLGSQGFGQTTFGQDNQQFVGRDSSDMQAVFNSLGRNSNQFFQQLNRTLGAGRNRQANQQPENERPPVRVQLHVAFDYSPPAQTALAGNLHSRLEKILAAHHVNQPEVVVDGQTVILRGTAANDSERLMLEKLVSLEPGVSAVANQMTLAPDTATEPAGPETDN